MAARCLAGLGGVAARRGEAMRTVQLLGAATARFAAHPSLLTPADEAFYRLVIGEARAQLDDAAFLVAWTAGEAMSAEESVAYALGESTK